MGKEKKESNPANEPIKRQKAEGEIKPEIKPKQKVKGKIKPKPKILTFCWLVREEDFVMAKKSFFHTYNFFKDKVKYMIVHDGIETQDMIEFENRNKITSVTYTPIQYKSFAAMRNLALNTCKTDYIFFIDSDEELEIDDTDKFLELLTDAKPEYAIINVLNTRDNKKEDTEINLIRILRTDQHFIYENVVMEDMRKSIRQGSKWWGVPKNKVRILHNGYSDDKKLKEKFAYQIKMLTDAINSDDRKNDHIILALMRMREGMLSLAAREYEYIIKTYELQKIELQEFNNKLAQLYFALSEQTPALYKEAFDYANKSLQLDSTQALPTFLIAEVYNAMKHYSDAAAAYRTAYLKLANERGNRK